MTQRFSGAWIVDVAQKDASFSQQFIVGGSVASDGVYVRQTTTPPFSIAGPQWSIRFERNDNAGSGWQPSDERRISAKYTLQDGLVVLLGADDNFVEFRDHDFNDLIVRCRNDDPSLNPWRPFSNPYNFLFSRRRKPRDPRPPRPPNR